MIRRLSRMPMLHRMSSAVIDQVLLSGANFLVGLLLIRYASDQDYGYYVLAVSIILLGVSAQGAWLGAPLTVLAPRRAPDERRAMVGRMRRDQRRWAIWPLLAGVAAAPLLVFAGVLGRYEGLTVVAATFAGWATLRREYLKTVLLIYARPQAILVSDVVYAALLLALVVVAVSTQLVPATLAVAGMGLAALAADRLADRSLSRDPGWDYSVSDEQGRVMWRQMRSMSWWATVGAVIYWVFSQGYNSMLGFKLDVAAVAAANAARLLLMPPNLLTTGVKSLLVPMSSRWLHESGLRTVIRRLSLAVAVLLVLDAIYLVILWLGRDWVSETVLRKVIPDRDMLLLLWALLSLMNVVRDVYQSALLALERFRIMAWFTAASAAISLTVMWFAIDRAGVAGALWGLIAGELFSLCGVVGQLLWVRYVRNAGIPPPGPEGPPPVSPPAP